MGKITFERLLDAASRATLDPGDSYHVSYPEFVRFLNETVVIDRHHLIVGASMVYAWMPTILRFKTGDFEGVAAVLNQVKSGHRVRHGEVQLVKQLINNSVPGASKLLHFAGPGLYPIWDRRICDFVNGSPYGVDKVGHYFEYVDNCDELVGDVRFRPLHLRVQEQLGYPVSAYRAVEVLMFEGA